MTSLTAPRIAIVIGSLFVLAALTAACGIATDDRLPIRIGGDDRPPSNQSQPKAPTDTGRTSEPASENMDSAREARSTPAPKPTLETSPTVKPALTPDPEPRLAESSPTNAASPPENICERNPEVQAALLESLGTTSCQGINEKELFRIRTLEVETDEIKREDLSGLVNVEFLRVNLEAAPPPGAFQDLQSLATLEVTTHEPPGPDSLAGMPSLRILHFRLMGEGGNWSPANIFVDLPSLELLTIIAPRAETISVTDHAFAELTSLGALYVAGPVTYEADSLTGLDRLTELHITSPDTSEWQNTDPGIPAQLLAALPKLQKVIISGYGMPAELHIHSLQVLCRLEVVGDFGAPDPVLISPQGPAQYIETQMVGNQTFCVVQLEDGTKETVELGGTDVETGDGSPDSSAAVSPTETPSAGVEQEPTAAPIADEPLTVTFLDYPLNH